MSSIENADRQISESFGPFTDAQRGISILYGLLFCAWGIVVNTVLVNFNAPSKLTQTNGLSIIWMLIFVGTTTIVDPIGDTRRDYCIVGFIYLIGAAVCYIV